MTRKRKAVFVAGSGSAVDVRLDGSFTKVAIDADSASESRGGRRVGRRAHAGHAPGR